MVCDLWGFASKPAEMSLIMRRKVMAVSRQSITLVAATGLGLSMRWQSVARRTLAARRVNVAAIAGCAHMFTTPVARSIWPGHGSIETQGVACLLLQEFYRGFRLGWRQDHALR
jgi:hypothetical protein